MHPGRRREDRVWAGAFSLGILGGLAWPLFEIGVAPSAVGVPGAIGVALAAITAVAPSFMEARRHGGSVGAAAKRGVRTLWEWVIDFVP